MIRSKSSARCLVRSTPSIHGPVNGRLLLVRYESCSAWRSQQNNCCSRAGLSPGLGFADLPTA